MIRSSSAATQAAREQAAKKAEEAKKAAEQPAAPKAPETKAPQPPKARTVESYSYGPGGERTKVPVTISEQNTPSARQSTLTIVGTGGRQVPYLSSEENVVTKSANHSVIERRVQRYDTEGRPTRQALVREEERKLANGTVERTTTVYEQDVNGSMQPAERTVAREVAAGSKTSTVVTTERPNPAGGFQAVEQRESVETRQGEGSAIVDTVVRRPNGNGRLTESRRERNVMAKAGNTATTETQVWERSTATGEVALTQRSVGKLVEGPDGSSTETIQVFGYSRAGGGASDANAGSGPRLVQTVQRETAVRPSGEKVETTTTLSRGVADPSGVRERDVVQKVIRPTADGESVETHVYEQGVNGRMQPTAVTVEQVKK
jgi:hypothetical protein